MLFNNYNASSQFSTNIQCTFETVAWLRPLSFSSMLYRCLLVTSNIFFWIKAFSGYTCNIQNFNFKTNMIIIFPSKKEKILNLISTKIKDRVEPILIGHSEYIKRNNFFLILALRIIKHVWIHHIYLKVLIDHQT